MEKNCKWRRWEKVTMERVGEQQDGRLWENARNVALMNYLRLENSPALQRAPHGTLIGGASGGGRIVARCYELTASRARRITALHH